MMGAQEARRVAFLDRDGVINVDHGYVCRWADFEFMPGAVQAMKRLREAGYDLVVVTNQSGIARGMYTPEDFEHLTEQMVRSLSDAGVTIAAVLHCPHHPRGSVPRWSQECFCRKPRPGMILEGLRMLQAEPGQAFMIGDKMSDVEAARAAGLGRAYLVTSDKNEEGALPGVSPDAVFADLAACVDDVLHASALAAGKMAS